MGLIQRLKDAVSSEPDRRVERERYVCPECGSAFDVSRRTCPECGSDDVRRETIPA